MLLTVRFPHEPFNTLVRNNRVGELLMQILEEIDPETVYFTEEQGKRTVVIAINVSEQSRIPSFAEPFFLNFNADCEFRIAMSPDDLAKAGLEALGKKWG